MPNKDASAEPEGLADATAAKDPKPKPRAKRKTATKPVTDAVIVEAAAVNAPTTATPEAEQPKKGPRFKALRATAGKALAIARRPKVALIAGAVILVGLNAWMAIAVDGWKSADADLRAQNATLGQDLADAQATNAFQVAQIALYTSQKTAADELAETLEPVAADLKEVSDSLKDAGNDLLTCAQDRGTLISRLWSSSASAQASFEAKVNAQCKAAQAKFKAIPEDN